MIAASLVALAMAGDLANPPPRAEIFGGTEVAPGQLESVVAITVGTGLCSGTLLTDTLVLTAAHCFASEPSLAAIEVVVGHDMSDPDAVLPVAEYGVHPCAARGCVQDGYDIAYVRLAEPAPKPGEGYPRAIFDQPEYDDLAAVGATVRVVGFGKDFSGDIGRKRSVDVTIGSFRSFGFEFEAGGKGRDSCDGDSGGPALALGWDGTLRIVGVLSRGFTCGSGGIYVVPLPSMCWVQDASGEAVVADRCGGCGCLDLDPDRHDDGGCRIPRDRSHWLVLPLLTVAAAVRRTSRRSRDRPRR